MRSELVDTKKALKKEYWLENGYQFLWRQSISSVALTPVRLAEDLVIEDLLEARIFTDGKELHLFYYEDELRAAVTEAEPGDDYLEEEQLLRERFGYSVTMRHYLGEENDGQVCIVRSVLNEYRQEG